MWVYLTCSTDLTSSPALADSASHSNHGCEQSPIVNETDTLRLCSCRECILTTSTELLSGTTLHRLEAPCFQVSTSSSADSHVRTSVLQDVERAWQESEADYFLKSSDSLATFDRLSFSWRTSQLSIIEDLNEFSWSSLRSGMTVAGRLYRLENSARRTCERDGGFLPTPIARDYKSPGLSCQRKAMVSRRQGMPLSAFFKDRFGLNLHPSFVEWMMGFDQRHTACDAWAMQWFQSRRVKHSKSYQESEV